MPSVTWQCPQCGRRVPNRAEECHCGMTRTAALAAPPPAPAAASPGRAVPGPARPRVESPYRLSWRALPRDIKLMAVGLVLVLVAGLGYLVLVPFRPKPIVPVLGWSEPTAPRPPVPKPTPKPRPKRKGTQS